MLSGSPRPVPGFLARRAAIIERGGTTWPGAKPAQQYQRHVPQSAKAIDTMWVPSGVHGGIPVDS